MLNRLIIVLSLICNQFLFSQYDIVIEAFVFDSETKKPIKKARLKVVPFTRFSLEGQTQFEQRNRKDRDSGGGVFATIADSTMGQDD